MRPAAVGYRMAKPARSAKRLQEQEPRTSCQSEGVESFQNDGRSLRSSADCYSRDSAG